VQLRLGDREFAPGELAVMAIINRTRDSFYDQGATFALPAALARIDQVAAEGADIIDVGGVRAGYGPQVSVAEEIDRTAPVVEEARRRHPSLVISVDTHRADVADAVCAAGADLINDTWAGADPQIPAVAASRGVGLVCSHVGSQSPRTDPYRVAYADVVSDVVARATALAERAIAMGVRRDGIIIDPTHDFGKNTWHSLQLTRALDRLVATGWPVLVSLSRKDFVGETLDLPVEQRMPGTLAATAVAAWLGARLFRAHDVAATRQALDMISAIRGTMPPRVPRRGLA
jgi:dihydropteroate synthase